MLVIKWTSVFFYMEDQMALNYQNMSTPKTRFIPAGDRHFSLLKAINNRIICKKDVMGYNNHTLVNTQ